ncbi:hypothetical protein [Haliscomenobacter sp.]|uniref:hypothetical protein n=1 Tax=Haliscomenobacter sp. TaxID=2717303 RepID=UPI003BAABF1C
MEDNKDSVGWTEEALKMFSTSTFNTDKSRKTSEIVEEILGHAEVMTQRWFDQFLVDLNGRLKHHSPQRAMEKLMEQYDKWQTFWDDRIKPIHPYSGTKEQVRFYLECDVRDWKAGEMELNFLFKINKIAAHQKVRRIIEYLDKLIPEKQQQLQLSIKKEINFEALFGAHSSYVIELAQKAKITNEQGLFVKNDKEKYFIVAFWMHVKTLKSVNCTDKKACEIIAAQFGTSIGKNLWGDKKESPDVGRAIRRFPKLDL